MTAQHLLVRRDDRNPAQVAEAAERFKARTGRRPTVLLIKAGTQALMPAAGLRVVETSVGVGKAEFGVGVED